MEVVLSCLSLNFPERNQGFYANLILLQICFTLFLIVLSFYPLPYGRYSQTNLKLNGRVSWIIMESPSLLIPLYSIWSYEDKSVPLTLFSRNILFLIPFLIHYFHRTLIYPFFIRYSNMPLFALFLGFSYTLFNGYLQTTYILDLQDSSVSCFAVFRSLLGIIIFAVGMVINIQSDYYLIELSKNKKFKGQYFIPRGALFEYISCPNFFGETLEWFGFAIYTWTLCGWGFFLQTFFTIIPRGYHHHKYYQRNFEDYPTRRKAVIPFIL